MFAQYLWLVGTFVPTQNIHFMHQVLFKNPETGIVISLDKSVHGEYTEEELRKIFREVREKGQQFSFASVTFDSPYYQEVDAKDYELEDLEVVEIPWDGIERP